ncbi:cell division protein FtsW [Bacteroidetes/Chlorobi group bacterium ChocPot_Mid]|jgi:cell division protein FtsW|nr:MAG: cell division protein FtsW [Bacteroidetes/Chlorobi group bacterium ChocPot_Mid]
MEEPKNHIDWYILLSVAFLMLFSIAFVYSASSSYAQLKFGSEEKMFWNHSARVLFGLLIIIVIAKIDYRFWRKISKILILSALVLLITVLLVGIQAKGASRWLDFGILRFQPSEFAKFALVIHLAALITRKQEVIKDFKKGMLPILIWTGAIALLIIMQPNLSTTLVIIMISLVMMYIGNTKLSHILSIGGVSMFIASVVVLIKSGYWMQRIKAFFASPEQVGNLESYSYQLQQSLIAFGNGGLFGLGPGLSRQSDLFLPESYGDFIFSIVGEEYGFIGTAVIISVFSFIFWRGMIVAKNAPDSFGYFLAIGIIMTLSINVLINAGVNIGLLPTTGLPMPFISYGGTAVIFHSASIGILLNISSQAGVFKSDI